jgi:hypothetical protein
MPSTFERLRQLKNMHFARWNVVSKRVASAYKTAYDNHKDELLFASALKHFLCGVALDLVLFGSGKWLGRVVEKKFSENVKDFAFEPLWMVGGKVADVAKDKAKKLAVSPVSADPLKYHLQLEDRMATIKAGLEEAFTNMQLWSESDFPPNAVARFEATPFCQTTPTEKIPSAERMAKDVELSMWAQWVLNLKFEHKVYDCLPANSCRTRETTEYPGGGVEDRIIKLLKSIKRHHTAKRLDFGWRTDKDELRTLRKWARTFKPSVMIGESLPNGYKGVFDSLKKKTLGSTSAKTLAKTAAMMAAMGGIAALSTASQVAAATAQASEN